MAELTKEVLDAAKKLWNLADFRSGIAKRRAQLKDVSDELERSRQRREALQMLPLPPDEAAAFVSELMARNNKRFEEHVHRGLQGLFLTKFRDANPDGPGFAGGHVPLVVFHPQQADAAIQYYFPDQVRAMHKRIAKEIPSHSYGPPRAEREAELKTLDTRIQELEAVEKAMVAEFEEMRGDIKR